METISNILQWTQIILSVLLIVVIMLQQSGAGLGGAFGGSDETGGSRTKRGLEKVLFNTTIVIAILFAVSSLIALIS
jgi:preprotein translocase subunit SecG